MKEYYETSDLGLAGTLCVTGYNLLLIDKSNPRRAIFRFERTNNLESTTELYWSGELQVPALQLLERIKVLKSRLYGV